MRKVAILSPSYDGKVACNFSIAMAEIYRKLKEFPDIQVNLKFWMYEALLQKARNNLFSEAMDDDVDDVVFIDCDQSFSADTFFRVLHHDVDVVGVPVRMKTDEERYNIRPEDPSKHNFNFDLGLLEVENIGTGFLRLSRRAMKAIWDRSQPYNDGNKIRRMICDLQIINGGIISEDIQICSKLREADIKIYVDIKETAKHFGTKCFVGEYRNHFLSSQLENLVNSRFVEG